MSKITDVRMAIGMARDGNLNDNRPAWWVIVVAIFFVAYLFNH